MLDAAELVLEPAVLLPDGLHLAPRSAASTGSLPFIPRNLRGLEVLVAEDEPVIALCLEQTLRDLGCSARCRVSPRPLALLGSVRPDVALLDVHMLDGAIFPVATWLAHAVRLEGRTSDQPQSSEGSSSDATHPDRDV